MHRYGNRFAVWAADEDPAVEAPERLAERTEPEIPASDAHTAYGAWTPPEGPVPEEPF